MLKIRYGVLVSDRSKAFSPLKNSPGVKPVSKETANNAPRPGKQAFPETTSPAMSISAMPRLLSFLSLRAG